MLFVVSEDLNSIEKIESQSFVSLKVWERTHIQEWVRKHPDILGEDLLIVNMEFDRFEGSRDRLDLLALDRTGNLVVVELKRDSFAGHADLQSIRYAAMISTMTVEQLLERYVDYHRSTTGEEVSQEKLRSTINEFVSLDDFEELSSRPRIILCSEDFSQEITTTVLWLRGFDLDISCVRLTPYRSEGKIILVPEKIIPLRESEQYITRVQEKEGQRQEKRVNLTQEELRELAHENGVGTIYTTLVEGVKRVFDRVGTTKSSVTFHGSSQKTILSLIPGESSVSDGLRFQVYNTRLADFLGVSEQEVASLLPEQREHWEYYKGAIPWDSGFVGFFRDSEAGHNFLEALDGSTKGSISP